MAESIAIIGAGIAGLSAGCYGRMNGYRTNIFELHDKPGGLCTSWKRGGYTFDACIHWLVGSRPDSGFNRVWRELGALPGPRIVDNEEFTRVEGEDGRTLIVYTDVDRLERHMKDLSPRDSRVIEEFTGAIRRFSGFEMPVETPGGLGLLKLLPGMMRVMGPMRRLSRVSTREFSEKFSDPFLREAFRDILELPDFPTIVLVATLAWMNTRDAGYPVGGSLAFSKTIERRYLDLGGTVSYGVKVERVLVEGDRAVGVRLEDGSEHRADVVISAADGHASIFDMLGGRYLDDEIKGYYENWPLWDPLVQVSIGVARDMSTEPHTLRFPLAKPIDAGGKTGKHLRYKHYCSDETVAPAGKSVVIVLLASDYDYWETLHGDPEKYEAEKKRIASDVVSALEARLPGFRDQVEVVDVASPVTYVRYTGNWRGSFEGFQVTKANSRYIVKKMKRTLPGLEGFYMAGQWVMPGGGLPPAALTAREVIKAICKKDGRGFVATEPAASG